GFSSTSPRNLLPSELIFSLSAKCLLSLSLYDCTELIPISGSFAFCKANLVPGGVNSIASNVNVSG
ncbi:unnamed protein product, partial [Staurois parvus]